MSGLSSGYDLSPRIKCQKSHTDYVLDSVLGLLSMLKEDFKVRLLHIHTIILVKNAFT